MISFIDKTLQLSRISFCLTLDFSLAFIVERRAHHCTGIDKIMIIANRIFRPFLASRFHDPPTLVQIARRTIRRFYPSLGDEPRVLSKHGETKTIPLKHAAYLRLHDFDSLHTN